MHKNAVSISLQDAQKISGVLELHICSSIASEAPASVRKQIHEEIKELNRIQKNIENQLNVPGDRRM